MIPRVLRVRSVWVLLPPAFGFTVWQTVDLMALRSIDGSQSHRIRVSYVFGFESDGCIVYDYRHGKGSFLLELNVFINFIVNKHVICNRI